jgi:hypothetical protein
MIGGPERGDVSSTGPRYVDFIRRLVPWNPMESARLVLLCYSLVYDSTVVTEICVKV